MFADDGLYTTFLPFPLILLNDVNALDVQNIFIAPEAYEVVSKEFAPFIADWEKLAGYSFAKVNPRPPLVKFLTPLSTLARKF